MSDDDIGDLFRQVRYVATTSAEHAIELAWKDYAILATARVMYPELYAVAGHPRDFSPRIPLDAWVYRVVIGYHVHRPLIPYGEARMWIGSARRQLAIMPPPMS